MSTIVHMSDPHFGTERAQVVDALAAFCAAQAPDLIVVSGDITQRARRHQFAAAQAFFERLKPAPLMVIPGNHDIPLFDLYSRMTRPYAHYRTVFGQQLETLVETPDMLVIGLNTTRPRRHKDGEISSKQVGRVVQQLQHGRDDQLRIVVTHQPIHVTRVEDEANLLHGGRVAAYAWSGAGVDLFLGGHIHLPYVRPLRERYTDLPRDAWVVQAGTAVSHRVRGGIPNSVNLIRYDNVSRLRQCDVERFDHDASTGRFIRVEQRTLLLDKS